MVNYCQSATVGGAGAGEYDNTYVTAGRGGPLMHGRHDDSGRAECRARDEAVAPRHVGERHVSPKLLCPFGHLRPESGKVVPRDQRT